MTIARSVTAALTLIVFSAASGSSTARQLPTEALKFIDKTQKEAVSKPNDIAAWNKFGAVSMRAALFDRSYYGKAEEAYGHVLVLDPDNLDALRGIGDIDYDKQQYDEAISAYEHYLKKKPDDAEVLTDLGTMYLYTGNANQAVAQYKRAIAAKPGFFQAYYNMGIAYAHENKPDDAEATLKQALALAPDDTARRQVKVQIGKLSGASSLGGTAQSEGCPITLAYLAPKLPQYSDPDLTRMRTTIIETNVSDVMQQSIKQGYTPSSAADAALRQAQADQQSLKSAEGCLGGAAADPDQAAQALQDGTFDFGNTSVSASCAKAYVGDYYAWVVNREVAMALACMAHARSP